MHGLRHSCASLLVHGGCIARDRAADFAIRFAAVTTGTYVEAIEAVQRQALDSMGILFENLGGDSSGRLSSKKSPLSSRLSSKSPKIRALKPCFSVELRGLEPHD